MRNAIIESLLRLKEDLHWAASPGTAEGFARIRCTGWLAQFTPARLETSR
jgi:hypothetical protein